MPNLKLRMKIGVHEFDAEGPAEDVNARFDLWREMIEARTTPLKGSAGGESFVQGSLTVFETPHVPKGEDDPALRRVFAVDEKRDIVTLRVHPIGENAEADAILALVYGYWKLRGNDEVRVTKLTRSVALSGLSGNRIDRMAAPYKGSAINKVGKSKGGKYMLTAPGRSKAEQVVREMFERVA